MCLDFFSEEAPCGLILVSDHLVFAVWVGTYGRFECIFFSQNHSCVNDITVRVGNIITVTFQ